MFNEFLGQVSWCVVLAGCILYAAERLFIVATSLIFADPDPYVRTPDALPVRRSALVGAVTCALGPLPDMVTTALDVPAPAPPGRAGGPPADWMGYAVYVADLDAIDWPAVPSSPECLEYPVYDGEDN